MFSVAEKYFQIIFRFVLLFPKKAYICLRLNNKTTTTMATTIAEAIAQSTNKGTDFNFVTIWETKSGRSKSYGFNWEKKEVGYSAKEFGVTRTVVAVIER